MIPTKAERDRAIETAYKVAKLPQWAQRHIHFLEREILEARAHVEEIQRGPADTDTLVDAYTEHPTRLPRSARVRFLLGDEYGDYIDVHTTERRPGQRVIELHGGTLLIIRPLSGNLASVELDQR